MPVHEVGRDGDTLFIVSDFIRGVTLTDWLTGNTLSAREIAELCIPIMDALHHAHQQGVIHRDLKPSNVMIDESAQPHLTDFGLAKRELGEITMTIDGQILGTPGYMSPEQAQGQSHWTDRRTDIYSFGVVLFHLLTGELPYRGNAKMQIHQRLTEDAPDPRKLNRHIPRDLATICLKCLEREPGRRYATAAEIVEELKRFVRGEPIKARPISAQMRAARWAKRKPWVASTAALVLLTAVVGPLTALRINSQRRQLEVRLHERNDLIEKTKNTVDQIEARNKQLTDRLAVWDGQAKPSDFWPPNREKPPRKLLLADLFDRSRDPLTVGLRNEKFTDESAARGYLSLAIMADSLDKRILAEEYYQASRKALVNLKKQNPGSSQFVRAVARCDARIAALSPEDRKQAIKGFDDARKALERNAADNGSDAVAQIEWLEAELTSAIWDGYETGKKHLERSDQIKKTLGGIWPSDPDGIYRIVCYLVNEEPILLQSETSKPSTATGAPVSQTNR